MKKYFFWPLQLLCCSLCFGQSYTSYFTGNTNDVQTFPLGGICLMGGATESNDAMKWFLKQAKGGDVLILRASGSDGYNDYFYSQLGVSVNSVESIVCNSAASAQEPYILQKIAKAEAIWFAGGDQWNYVKYWRNSPVDSLINEGIAMRNIVVGGTSAGMAILGQYYFSAQYGSVSSATALANPYHNTVRVDSTAFIYTKNLQHVITDTHYDNPDRKGRQIAFLARISKDFGVEGRGIACDEYTAVCIDSAGMASVYGNFPSDDDNAYFIQQNCQLSEQLPENCSAGSALTWNLNGAALRVYRAKGTKTGAQKFNLRDWRSGVGGVWQNWSVNNGVLIENPGNPVNCTPLSLENPGLAAKIKISPNPSAQNVQVEASGFLIKKITLMDLNANKVQEFLDVNSQVLLMDCKHLPSGTYLIKIETENGVLTQKMIISL